MYGNDRNGNPAYGPYDPSLDPNSPERKKAAKLIVASKVLKVIPFICFGILFLSMVLLREDGGSPLLFILVLPCVASMLLSAYLHSKALKLICTKRTTAHCVDTVRRRSGKHVRRHPIVEYEADGVPHTAELSVTCTHDAVGELYTIYYDPLDPDTVRVE